MLSGDADVDLSVILHHQIEHPFAAPLFRFAVFISGTSPLSRSEDIGWDVTNNYRNVDLNHYLGKEGTTKPLLEDETEASQHETNSGVSKWSDGPSIVHAGSPASDGEATSFRVRWWWPTVDTERIQIPTAHIYGARGKDHWLDESILLENMCEPSLRHTYQHGSAHEIPMRMGETKKMAEIIQKTAIESEIVG